MKNESLEESKYQTQEKDMKKFLTVVGLLTVVATPALAQPFWPYHEPPHAFENGQGAFAKAGSKGPDFSSLYYAQEPDESRSPPPGAYNNLGR
jgi:hypothetical protein